MARVRPVVETGYENMLLLRLLLEGTPVEDILDYWSVLLPETMKSWGLERGDMVDFSGAERTAWMEGQPDQWLDINRIYEDVDKALAPVSGLPHCYVVTTKPQNLTIKLLKHKAMSAFPTIASYRPPSLVFRSPTSSASCSSSPRRLGARRCSSRIS